MHAVTQEWVRRTRHGGVCLAMSVSFLAGCDAVSERSTTEQRWDSAGIAVVEHTALEREGEAELTPTLILTVDAVEGMPPFGQLADVSILSGGRLAVADAGTRRVHMLSRGGTHEWSAGSEGDGPGQFRGIDRLIVSSGDSVLAVDVQLGRLTPISTDGGVGAPERLLPDAGVPVGRMETGSLLYRQQRPEGERRLGIQHTVATWSSVDRRSGERQVIATMPGNDGYFGQAGGRNVVLAPPFLRRLLGAPTPSGLVVAHSDRPQIDEYGAEGSLRRSIRIAEGILASDITNPGSVTDSMLALTPEPTRQVLAQAIREIPIPDRWPSMDEIIVDDQERLWIQSYRALGQQSVTWRVFASDGSYLGAFDVPHQFEAHDVRGEMMAGVWTGDLDLESVRVYRIDGVR